MSLWVVPNQTIIEPVTLTALKARLKLTSTADDTLLAGILVQAREFAERVSRRALAYRAFTYTMDRFWHYHPREPISVPVPPLIAVSSITYYDPTGTLQTLDPTDYWVASAQQPALISPALGQVWPDAGRQPDSVTISFAAGYGYPGSPTATPPIPAGPVLPISWLNNLVDIAVFTYENAGAVIPDALVQIPKIFIF